MQENFELNQKAIKLTQELDQLNNAYKKVQQEKIAIETEFEKELKTWENTAKHLKKIISESDLEKKGLETEIIKLKGIAERCNHNECMIVELKYGIDKINEDRQIEKEAIKEQIEVILEELGQVRHEKEEILSEKLMFENEAKKYRLKIAFLEDEIKRLKESLELNRGDIFAWCSDRSSRRNLLKNKQNRIYAPQSSKHLNDLVNKKPCHT